MLHGLDHRMKAQYACRNFEFTLATKPAPDVTATTPRLQVSAAAATIQLAYGGKLVVTTSGLTAQAFKVTLPVLVPSNNDRCIVKTPQVNVP